MGLFDRKNCDICGEKINMLTRVKLSDGFLCGNCKNNLSAFSSHWKRRTLSQAKDHISQREQNLAKYQAFRQTAVAGSKDEKLIVDSNQGWFYFAFGRDFKQGNPEIFDFDQLNEFYIEEIYDPFTKDEDDDGIPDHLDADVSRSRGGQLTSQAVQGLGPMMGNGMVNRQAIPGMNSVIGGYIRQGSNAFDEKGFPRTVEGYQMVFFLSHPYIDEVTVRRVTRSDEPNRVTRILQDQLAVMQLCEQIRHAAGGTAFNKFQQGFAQPQQGAAAQSSPQGVGRSQPGAMSSQSTSQGFAQPQQSPKFCPYCGQPNGAGMFCSSCGGRL